MLNTKNKNFIFTHKLNVCSHPLQSHRCDVDFDGLLSFDDHLNFVILAAYGIL